MAHLHVVTNVTHFAIHNFVPFCAPESTEGSICSRNLQDVHCGACLNLVDYVAKQVRSAR